MMQRVYIQHAKGEKHLPYDFQASEVLTTEEGCSVVVDDKRYHLTIDVNKTLDEQNEPSYLYDASDERTFVLQHTYGVDTLEELPDFRVREDYCTIIFDYVDSYVRSLKLRDYKNTFDAMSEREQNTILSYYVEAVEDVINAHVMQYGGRLRTSLADWKLFDQFSIDHPELHCFTAILSEDGIAYGRARSQHERNLSAMQSYWLAGWEIALEDRGGKAIDKWRGCWIKIGVKSRYYASIFIKIDEKSPMCDIELANVYNREHEHLTRIDIRETFRYLTLLNFDHAHVEWNVI